MNAGIGGLPGGSCSMTPSVNAHYRPGTKGKGESADYRDAAPQCCGDRDGVDKENRTDDFDRDFAHEESAESI